MLKTAITCPTCHHSREIDPGRIPAGATRAVCPKCGGKFPLPRQLQGEGPTPVPVQGPAAPEPEGFPPSHFPTPLLKPETADAEPRRVNLVFTGKAAEYFGIWIVNTLLKIVTLGIYSPWAKVRKRQYFYGNTLLDEVSFDYLASPLALLKGWLIAAALFLLYSVGSNFSPALSGVLGILFFLAMPWLIVRSRMFNNRYSSHRNIRFDFAPNYRGAYEAFAWLPLLTPFTLGLLFPYVMFRQKRFLMENNRFGRTSFSFNGRAGDFYGVFLKAFGLFLLLAACMGGLFAGLGPGLGFQSLGPQVLPVLLSLLFAGGYLLLGLYVYARLSNLTWNATHLGENRFVSTLRARELAWIFFSNAVAIALSFGLLIPWASVRLARYRVERLALDAPGDLGNFLAGTSAEVSAAGEEIGDVFGLDIGI